MDPTDVEVFDYILLGINTVVGLACVSVFFGRRNLYPIRQRGWRLVLITNILGIIYIPVALIPDAISQHVANVPCSGN